MNCLQGVRKDDDIREALRGSGGQRASERHNRTSRVSTVRRCSLFSLEDLMQELSVKGASNRFRVEAWHSFRTHLIPSIAPATGTGGGCIVLGCVNCPIYSAAYSCWIEVTKNERSPGIVTSAQQLCGSLSVRAARICIKYWYRYITKSFVIAG